jgi:hypothetical protein
MCVTQHWKGRWPRREMLFAATESQDLEKKDTSQQQRYGLTYDLRKQFE